MTETVRLYGVSYGNGNDGVSQLYPDFYCRTDRPYDLATLAMVEQFKPEWQAKALAETSVDGEADYTISATIYEPLDSEPAENDDRDNSWSGSNGAYAIVEVFPVDDKDVNRGKPFYDTLADAFNPATVALFANTRWA